MNVWRRLLLLSEKHRASLTALLLIGFAIALGANIVKYQWIRAPAAFMAPAWVSAAASVCSAAVIVLGAVFSYFRFFRGRTFSLRAELDIEVSVHALAGGYLHTAVLRARNVGTSAIWFPRATIGTAVDGAEARETHDVTDWPKGLSSLKHGYDIIESGESQIYVLTKRFEASAAVVTYFGVLRADAGNEWHAARSVANRATE